MVDLAKKTSALASDLGEPMVRQMGLDAGLVDYKICAVDQTWSGLAFAVRRSGPSAGDRRRIHKKSRADRSARPGLSEIYRCLVIHLRAAVAAGATIGADFFSGMSATMASVVSIREAMEAAFSRAVRVTLVGSMTPAATRSS